MNKRKPTVRHTQESPFPFTTKDGSVIVNETCACGSLRSQHQDTAAYGHGQCLGSGCEKFRWAGYVFKVEIHRAAFWTNQERKDDDETS